MSPARKADADPDSLVEEVTADCYDEDEQLMGFQNALEEDANLVLRKLIERGFR